MKSKTHNISDQKLRERIHSIPITTMIGIDQEQELFDLKTLHPDFFLIKGDKYIGIEVIEVRPHKYFNTKHIDLNAINDTLESIIRSRLFINNICAFRIDVIPQEDIYYGKIDKNNVLLIKEIDDHLNGKPQTREYIKLIKSQPLYINGEKHIIPNDEIGIYIEWEGGFVETIPIAPVIDAIQKKEKLFDEYMDDNDCKFNEIWLFISMSNEEYKYSFKGFELPKDYYSKYDKILVGQLFPPFANCIYRNCLN